ncbi:MAG: carboxylesterase family protein [Candidatus Jordarchaeaceae archaeon]
MRRRYLVLAAVIFSALFIVSIGGSVLVSAATIGSSRTIATLSISSATVTSSSSDPLVVGTNYGSVRGLVWDSYTYAWLGIPYAKPPIGELRWKAPQNPEPWSGILNATKFPKAPMQVASVMGSFNEEEIVNSSIIGSEDCLYLNIWVPKTSTGKLPVNLPVFVWIYGGGNIAGQTAMPLYYGANLARKANAIVVTLNYRVGIEGWFYHPALRTGDALNDSGNYGLLDIVKALEWVRGNIKNFGGNPNMITVAGESAGGMNIYSLLTSPYVKQQYFDKGNPLFHRAIIESGGIMPSSLEQGEQAANGVLAYLLVARGIAGSIDEAMRIIAGMSPQEISALLRNAPMEEIYEAIKTYGATNADILSVMTNLMPIHLLIELLPSNLIPLVSDIAGKISDLFETIMDLIPPELLSSLMPTNGSAGAGLFSVMGSVPSIFADGYVVARNPFISLRDGTYIKVPVIIGGCEEEFKFFLSMMFSDMESYMDVTFGRYIPTLEEYLASMRPWPEELAPFLDWLLLVGYDLISTIGTKLWELMGVDIPASLISKHQNDVYAFRFCWNQEPEPLDFLLGACHSLDVPFVFGNVGEGEGFPYCNFAWTNANKLGRIALSNAMISYFSNFMKNGNPGDPDGLLGRLPRWDNYPSLFGCERIIFDATNILAVIYMDDG